MSVSVCQSARLCVGLCLRLSWIRQQVTLRAGDLRPITKQILEVSCSVELFWDMNRTFCLLPHMKNAAGDCLGPMRSQQQWNVRQDVTTKFCCGNQCFCLQHIEDGDHVHPILEMSTNPLTHFEFSGNDPAVFSHGHPRYFTDILQGGWMEKLRKSSGATDSDISVLT